MRILCNREYFPYWLGGGSLGSTSISDARMGVGVDVVVAMVDVTGCNNGFCNGA